ncbi:hypothetical protein P7K49_008933 [Saguinus oedipus]|uniref:Uncharacterized protein n=1 Tax=Saguinus oedipus TaxID=9490 RepID=A0ABQ9W2R3_SAGOE|nr:hypothetical protein P7K49_008933 [Saguinus oedipus]
MAGNKKPTSGRNSCHKSSPNPQNWVNGLDQEKLERVKLELTAVNSTNMVRAEQQ